MNTKPLFLLTLVVAVLVPFESLADSKDDLRLPENLVFRLIIEEHDETIADLRLLLAHERFHITHLIRKDDEVSSLRFQGVLTKTDDEEYYLQYTFGRSVPVVTGEVRSEQTSVRRQVTHRDVGWESTVQLKVGEAVTIFQDTKTTYRLSLSRPAERTRENETP